MMRRTQSLPRTGDGQAGRRRGNDASGAPEGRPAPSRAMKAKRHSVLLVEDDEVTRARLARAIETHPELRLSGTAGSCREAIAALGREAPDVLLTDLGLPDGNGIDLIREVRRRELATESMAITIFGDERHVVAAVEAGATGYLLKDGSSDYVTESILQLLAGGSPISPPITKVSPSCTTAVVSASCVLNAGKVLAPIGTSSPRALTSALSCKFTKPFEFTCGMIVRILPVLRYWMLVLSATPPTA